MKIFNLYEFNTAHYHDFTDFSNENWAEPWSIYLECCGGSNWIAHQMINILNLKSGSQGNVFMNVTKAYSNGFRMMMEFDGPVNILESAEGMWHQGTFNKLIRLDNKGSDDGINNYSSILKKQNKVDLKNDLELARLVMTESEVEAYLDGKDVFFTEKQLQSFLKKKDLVIRK